jgi:hypothetical protein
MQKDYSQMMPAPATAEAPMEATADPNKTDKLREDILAALEKQGVMEQLTTEEEINEIMQLVDQLVEAMASGDQAAIQENPLLPLIAGQPEGMAGPEAAAPQGGM